MTLATSNASTALTEVQSANIERSLTSAVKFSFDTRLIEYEALEGSRFQADNLLKTLRWKSTHLRDWPLIVCLMGGTGTGKSTIFNSLTGRSISKVGVQRPCTNQAIVLIHEEFVSSLDHFPCFEKDCRNDFQLYPHRWTDLKHLVLVDTPDFDSVATANHLIAKRFFLLSDVLILVTSQEKYADFLCRELASRALTWGKKTIFLMNKVASHEAFDDYLDSLRQHGDSLEPVRVERIDPPPECIDRLRSQTQFSGLFRGRLSIPQLDQIRSEELLQLMSQSEIALADLENSIRLAANRIHFANSKIDEIFTSVSQEMHNRLDVVLSSELEAQIKSRLAGFLRQYDILFVPRMMARKTIGKIVSGIQGLFTLSTESAPSFDHTTRILTRDIEPALHSARLQPLEEAVAKFNLRTSEFLSQDPKFSDLCAVARESVSRFNSEKIRALYERAFPGIERVVEIEVDRFRRGLSTVDEIKLYGSYTLWALLIVTVELAVGGGFTLLDALLNTVIMPFIPPWLLRLKVMDLLREIGERADAGHREAVQNVLKSQAQLYKDEFSALLPNDEALGELRRIRESLILADQCGTVCGINA